MQTVYDKAIKCLEEGGHEIYVNNSVDIRPKNKILRFIKLKLKNKQLRKQV